MSKQKHVAPRQGFMAQQVHDEKWKKEHPVKVFSPEEIAELQKALDPGKKASV